MLLHIANCTKQDLDFIYRLPGDPRMKLQKIKVGTQAKIYKDAPLETLQHIIKQHERYGLVSVEEAVKAGSDVFVGACWSFKPIDMDKVVHTIDHNDGVIHDRGVETRKESAVAASDAINRDTKGSLTGLEVTIAEETKDGDGYSEVIEVREHGSDQREISRRRKH